MYEQVAYRPYKDIPLVTALPSNPTNGDMCVLTDSLTAGTYQWMFKYVQAKASNKWVFIGGAPLQAEVATSEGTTATSYAALATAGPSVAVPVAGDYIVTHGCHSLNNSAGVQYMSYDIGGTGANDNDAIDEAQDSNTRYGNHSRSQKKSLTAVTLTSKYKTSAGTGTYKNRFINIVPIAIGG